MKPVTRPEATPWRVILFLSLVFLLFFQLVSDFIESVYTFGLLGTDIPPEMVSIVLFFTPLLLLFKKRLPLKTVFYLAGAAAILRAMEIVLAPNGKMLAGGLGTGLLLILFPVLLTHIRPGSAFNGLVMGAGLTIALSLSILLRTLGAGSDISTLFPWIGWLICGSLLLAVLMLLQTSAPAEGDEQSRQPGFWRVTALSIGFMGTLLMLYFAFTSPTVLARWSGTDYRLVLLTLGTALSVFLALLVHGRIRRISPGLLGAWNTVFLLAGTGAILINQTAIPAESNAYPLYQTMVPWGMQIPLFLMLLLSPIILIDFTLLTDEISTRQPSMRQLAVGFTIAALVFLLIVLAQVFTTVYDYIPVIGPWFRDRFWLVFLAAGLSLVLPMLAVHRLDLASSSPALRVIFFPVVLTCMLTAIVFAVVREPAPLAAEDPGPLRVLTYNIQQGYDQHGQRAYLEQLEVIRHNDPDILGLQETDVARFSGGNADIVRLFAEGLNMSAYYGPKTVNGTFGIALLSRYPLENPQTFYMYSAGEQTAAITAEIVVRGVRYHVLVTHLGNGGPIIQQQQVLEELQGKSNVIAMGDFNFRTDTEQYALTTQTLDNAWVVAGEPITPGLEPSSLIDHIFVSPGMAIRSSEYIVSEVSDHPGLLVEIGP